MFPCLKIMTLKIFHLKFVVASFLLLLLLLFYLRDNLCKELVAVLIFNFDTGKTVDYLRE